MKRITSRQNAMVARFRAVARGDEPGLLLDGPHLVAEALSARAPILQIAVTADGLERPEIRSLVEQAERRGAPVASVSPAVMSAVSPVRSSSLIVAVAERPPVDSERVFAGTPLVVVACNVQDPGNLGAMIRVAEAAGGTGVIAAGQSADPFGPKALRGSMGSALRFPTLVTDASDAVDRSRRHGCQVIAAIPHGGRSIFETDLRGPVAILIGGEGAGLTLSLINTADDRLSIPMQSPVESLNAAVTAALVLYEARRQRGTSIDEQNTSHVALS
jgi:RNA methyltransferase, TrmH family